MNRKQMKRYRVREVWMVTSWATVDAPDVDTAERLLEAGEGTFDKKNGEWDYAKTLGEIEEVP